MLFRVTLSTDVDEYYKENPRDFQVSLTVEADDFEVAMIKAKADVETYVFWPKLLKVVTVVRMEDPVKEDETIFKMPSEWQIITGVYIRDPDGWRGRNDPSWWTPITRDEFIKRAMISTCSRWPSPLLDEV